MAKKRKADEALTHEELWDDSYLMRVWQDVKAEYIKYHSIDMRGENVDELLKQYEAEENARFASDDNARAERRLTSDAFWLQNGNAGNKVEKTVDDKETIDDDDDVDVDVDDVGDDEVDADDEEDEGDEEAAEENEAQTTQPRQIPMSAEGNQQQIPQAAAMATAIPEATSVPQTLLATIKDETLRGMMMSWYYAGYYTGLADGQKARDST